MMCVAQIFEQQKWILHNTKEPRASKFWILETFVACFALVMCFSCLNFTNHLTMIHVRVILIVYRMDLFLSPNDHRVLRLVFVLTSVPFSYFALIYSATKLSGFTYDFLSFFFSNFAVYLLQWTLSWPILGTDSLCYWCAVPYIIQTNNRLDSLSPNHDSLLHTSSLALIADNIGLHNFRR